MKLIGGKVAPFYVGYHAVCQFCGQHVVFEDGDLKMVEKGDMKDEAKYRLKCPTCKGATTSSPSRLKANHNAVHDKRH